MALCLLANNGLSGSGLLPIFAHVVFHGLTELLLKMVAC